MGLLENLAQGFSNAAGDTNSANAIQKVKDDRRATQHEELEGKTKSILADVTKLQDRRAALPAGSPEIAGIDKALAEHQKAFSDLYHPINNPGNFQKLGGFLKQHIAGKEPTPPPQSNAVTPERMAGLQASAAGTAPPEVDAGEKFKRQYKALTGKDAPPELLERFAEKQGGLTEQKPPHYSDYTQGLRRFVESKGGDPDNPTAEEEQAFRKTRSTAASAKGMKFDTTTGEVVDQATGKRYAPGDATAPPEAAAMFKGAEAVQRTKQAYAERLATVRGASYGLNRGFQVLDTANGNAPAIATLADIKKQPGRYQPAGPGAKALSQENLFQDIIGTSQQTRQAITNLKADFPPDMKVKIALAMKADDPHAAIDQLVSSGALGSLSDDQQDFLIATRQLSENAMAMRTILGAGQGSEDMRNAIRATLPTLLSPDKSYATRQLDAFDKTVARLHRGVPRVNLPDINPGDLKNNAASTAGQTKNYKGHTYNKQPDGSWKLQQ